MSVPCVKISRSKGIESCRSTFEERTRTSDDHNGLATNSRQPEIKSLPNGDHRDAVAGLTSSAFFTNRHGQFFIVCAERLDRF